MMPVLIVVALLALSIVFIYNGLVRLRVQCDNAWADIDVQLKRRYDLIPNLVETVKGYAAHERGTFEAVTQARNQAMSSEAYPQRRAADNFAQLQATLGQIEDTLQNARRYYNAAVRDFNTRVEQFPSNMVAGMGNFKPREFFEISAPAEREVPHVSFSATPTA
jgi:LemA protein